MGPRAGLDRCGKPHPPTGIRFPDGPARSRSLDRLRYPDHGVLLYIYIVISCRAVNPLRLDYDRQSGNVVEGKLCCFIKYSLTKFSHGK